MPLSILPSFLPSVCRRSWTGHLRTLVRAGIGLAALAALAPQALAFAVSTQIALTGSGPSILGQPVTFTVQVTPAQQPAPTGYIVVGDLNDLTLLATEPLGANGQATFSSSRLAPGKNSLYAAYLGDRNHLPSYTGNPLVWTEYASTTTTLASGTGSSVYGQPVVFTATVASSISNVTGPVSFFANGALIGTATLTKTGSATLTVATLAVAANQSITASYGGDGSHAPSTSSAVEQTVAQDATTTSSLTSSFSTPGVGAQVTYTVSVMPNTPGGGTPTGTVIFQDTSTTPPTTVTGTLGNGTASSAPTASATFTFQAQGSHPITAVYGGDADFTGSTAPPFTQAVQATGNEPVTVTLSLAPGSPSSFVFGQPVTLTATVTGSGPTPPTGTVTFYDTVGDPMTTALGVGPVGPNGDIHITFTDLPTGNGILTAEYGGNGFYQRGDTGSASAPAVTVVKANSTTQQVSSSFNPSGLGATVTFTAVVSGSGVPTGTVTFAIDGVTAPSTATSPNPAALGPASTTSASATYSTSSLTEQTHSITATYSGDGNFNPSDDTATPLSQGVQATGTYPVNVTVALSSPGGSTEPVFGQSVTFLATVANASSSPGLLETTPQGSVVFQVGGVPASSQVPLDSTGSASFPTTLLATGSNSVTANYQGDDYYAATLSPAFTQVVAQDSTTLNLSSNAPSAAAGSADVTFTATVVPAAPGAGTPTGSVTFYDTSTSPTTQLGISSLAGGMASFTPPAPGLSVGAHTITASYSGDTNYQSSSTSSPLNQTMTPGTVNTATQVYLSSGAPTTTSTDTFTVNVSSAAGTPTGSVTFSDDANDPFSPATVPLSGGTATSSCSALTAGTRIVTAAYTPDTSSFDGSSGNASLFVSQITSTSLAATTPATSATAPGQLDVYFGENVSISATVTDDPPSGTMTPTGTVTFYEYTPPSSPIPTASYGPYTLDANGKASFPTLFNTSTFSPITNTFQAEYNPNPGLNALFVGSNSPGLQAIETPSESTATALTASSYSIKATDSITFTATVTDTTGPYTPGGTVTFYDTNVTVGSAQTTLGTVTLNSSGVATLNTPSLTPGNHATSAVFVSTGFVGSHSVLPITVTVNALTASNYSITPGQSITVTATLTGTPSPPGDTVTFYDTNVTAGSAQTTLGTATLNSSGVATLTTTSLTTAGSHSLSAVFPSSGVVGSHGVLPITVTVNALASQISPTISPNYSPLAITDSFTLQATVAPASPDGFIPTGSVTFTFTNGTDANPLPGSTTTSKTVGPYTLANGSIAPQQFSAGSLFPPLEPSTSAVEIDVTATYIPDSVSFLSGSSNNAIEFSIAGPNFSGGGGPSND
jgi:hypothetical protein